MPEELSWKLNSCRIYTIPENAIVQINPLKTSLQILLFLTFCYFCPLLGPVAIFQFFQPRGVRPFSGKPWQPPHIWLDWRNGTVSLRLERSKQRLLVTIGKVVAESKSVIHIGRKNGPKTRFSARPRKKIGSLHLHPSFFLLVSPSTLTTMLAMLIPSSSSLNIPSNWSQ